MSETKRLFYTHQAQANDKLRRATSIRPIVLYSSIELNQKNECIKLM